MKRYYIFNGRQTAEKGISLSKLKRGFLYGDGIFETLHAVNYSLFRWDDHWERMQKGIGVCNLRVAGEGTVLKDMIENVLKKHRLVDAYVRVSVFRRETDSFDPKDERRSNVLIQMKKYHPYPEIFYKRGITCIVSRKYFRNEMSPLSNVKSFNYLENILARIEAKQQGYQDAIFLNTKGFLTSATVSNLFFVKKKRVFTPSIDCGVLPGITRKVVFEICKEQGIKIIEGMFLPEELKEADEVFLTNTLMGVMPVREVKGIFKSKHFPLTVFFRNELNKISV
jgi:aminodeoxychorismate lyase